MPGGNKAITGEDGKKFSSSYQPANPGRKPKVFSALAKEFAEMGIEKASPHNVAEAYEYLLALPLSEVIKIAGNPKIENDMPSLFRLAAKEMMGKRGIEILKEMLDRAHGKPKQQHDLTSGGAPITSNPLEKLPIEEQADVLRKINKANADK